MEKIKFCPEQGEPVDFYVLEQTTLGGINYILVSDTENEDGEALILKDISEVGAEEAVYAIVSEDAEMNAVAEIFQNLLEDIDLEK